MKTKTKANILIFLAFALFNIYLINAQEVCKDGFGYCNPNLPKLNSKTPVGSIIDNNTFSGNSSTYDTWALNYTNYYNKSDVDNNLSLYVPYTGATSNIDLGSKSLATTGNINGSAITSTGLIFAKGSTYVGGRFISLLLMPTGDDRATRFLFNGATGGNRSKAVLMGESFDGAGDFTVFTASNFDYSAGTATWNQRFHVTNTGDTGLGTATVVPQSGLEIKKLVNAVTSGTTNLHMFLTSPTATAGQGVGIGFGLSTDNPNTNVGAKIVHIRTGTNSIGDLAFYTKPNTAAGDTSTEKWRITSAGHFLAGGTGTGAFNITTAGNINTAKVIATNTINTQTNFSVNNIQGITGNYTNGNCWTYYNGGIVTATNCSLI